MPVALALIVMALAAAAAARLRSRRLVGVVTAVAVAAAVAIIAVGTGWGLNLESNLGAPATGVPLLVRVTPAEYAVIVTASLALLYDMARALRPALARCGNLVSLAGVMVVACAGSGVMIAAGLFVVASGTGLSLQGERLRVPAAMMFTIGIGGAIAMLVAAVEIQTVSGTNDLAVVPGYAVSRIVVLMWVGAGALALIALAVAPSAAVRRGGAAWWTAGAMPAGIAALLQFQFAESIPLDGVTVAVVRWGGCAVGVAAALSLVRRSARSADVARGLCTVAAAGAITWSTASGDASNVAFMAALVALLFSAFVLAPRRGPARPQTDAVLMVVATGFAVDAAVLSVAAAADGAGLALAAGFAIQWLVVLGAVGRAVRHDGIGRIGVATGIAAAVALVAAIFPGAVINGTAAVFGVLGPEPHALSVVTAAGWTWPGGYIVLAVALAAVAVWSICTLLAIDLPRPAAALRRAGPREPVLRRRIARGAQRCTGVAVAADAWLVGHSRMVVVAVIAGAAVLVIR